MKNANQVEEGMGVVARAGGEASLHVGYPLHVLSQHPGKLHPRHAPSSKQSNHIPLPPHPHPPPPRPSAPLPILSPLVMQIGRKRRITAVLVNQRLHPKGSNVSAPQSRHDLSEGEDVPLLLPLHEVEQEKNLREESEGR